ncbi:MAG TPA: serine/threonine-protein kinase [Gemmataceae bacterium]|nr:serine/threonine-protein kinase [Gemmataceae bacterium]
MADPIQQQGGKPAEPGAAEPSATASDAVRATMSVSDPLPPEPPARVPSPSSSGALPNIAGFDVLVELARGGMGVVYKARQRSLNRIVALKMIRAGELADKTDLHRFTVEAEAVARIQHPNVVQIHEIGQHDGRPFLCLEFVEGGNLDKLFSGQPQPARPLAALVETLARAMHVVHQHGIIHRDLKPANVLMSCERRTLNKSQPQTSADSPAAPADDPLTARPSLKSIPKIGDFGLAKRLVENERGLTPTHAILGTPEYMAPEQAAGMTSAIGPHTDIYALGAILFEGMTGQPPFCGNSWMETLQMVMTRSPTLPSRSHKDLPRDLKTICLKCLHKEPGGRYPTAEALADDLRRFLAGEPIHARPPGPVERGVKWLRRHWTAAAFIVLAGLLVPLALIALTRTPSTPPPAPVLTDVEVRAKASALRRTMAATIVKTTERNGWIQYDPDPSAAAAQDMWTHSQGLAGLLANPDATPAELRKLLPLMDLPFGQGQRIEVDGFKYGWRSMADAVFTRADPALWTVCYLARALGKPQFLTADERKHWQSRLEEAQDILRNYRPPDFKGGWNPVPRQKNPNHVSCYETALALFALVECKAADLPWDGSKERRDQLLKATAEWLIGHFQEGNPAGWRGHVNDRTDPVYDGLTLKIYAGLLRAESLGAITIPANIAQHIPKHLAGCANRHLDYPVSTIVEGLSFTAPSGQQMSDVNFAARAQWYPWAIKAAALWLRRAEKMGVSAEELTPVRRALAHLVTDVGDEVVVGMKTLQTFVAAESLYGLAEVPLAEIKN